MKIYSVFDPEFKPYGQIVTGMDDTVREILDTLALAPITDGVEYVPEYEPLQELPAMVEVSDHLFGGMPVQLGWCNGHNTKLNCLEYHRDSELNIGLYDFVLLVAKADDIIDGKLDTSKVMAFRASAGQVIEVYATSLHYAPCNAEKDGKFKVAIVLPKGTNYDMPNIRPLNDEDKTLRACNKWLLAHKDAAEASDGAYIGLTGENVDIADSL